MVKARASRASRAERAQRSRPLVWGLSVLALVLGGLAFALGYLVQSVPEDRTAQPLPLDAPYTVGERVPFVGALVVYGTPTGGERPELDELGCEVTEGGGPLSTEAAERQDRVVVEGRGLVPLVQFPGREGYSIACTGPAAAAAAPLYVVPGATSRDLLPLAGYCVAALLVPLGLLGVLTLVASRD